eukprot:Em0003g1054a
MNPDSDEQVYLIDYYCQLAMDQLRIRGSESSNAVIDLEPVQAPQYSKVFDSCTPNGAVSYVSPLYVGSISYVELTRISGFLVKLEDKPGISIMVDQGFTVKDMLEKLGIDLNIPPFLDGRQQLPYEEIEAGLPQPLKVSSEADVDTYFEDLSDTENEDTSDSDADFD